MRSIDESNNIHACAARSHEQSAQSNTAHAEITSLRHQRYAASKATRPRTSSASAASPRDDAVRGHRPSATHRDDLCNRGGASYGTVAHTPRDVRQHRPERGTRPHHTELPETAATCCSDWARHVLLRHVLLRRRCVLSTQTAASFLCETTFIRRTAPR